MNSVIEKQTYLNFSKVYREKRMNFIRLLSTVLRVNIVVSERIVSRFSFFELNTIDRYDLLKVEGVTKEVADTFFACFDLVRLVQHEEVRRDKVNGSECIYKLMCPMIGHLPHEEFYIVLLNRANKIVKVQKISQGGITGTVIDVRLIFRHAINQKASSVILVHNHPSGNRQPSEADIMITKKCKDAGQNLDVPVLDHIIITEEEYFSFADEGMI